MITEKLRAIIETLQHQGKMRFLLEATEEQISQFEGQAGIHLPNAYRDWLQFSDGGECFLPAGIQLYGVAHKPLIDPNDNDRPSKEYAVIGSLASGDPILCKEGSERISIYNHDAGLIEDDEEYEDFYAFLTDLHVLLGIGG